MYSKLLSFFVFIFGLHATCFAQFYPTQYRPAQHWQQLQTPHFKFIYAQKNYAEALELAKILESQYSSVQDIVGGELDSFPIILNNYNDRSNGFVTPYNFRSEIELPPIKGKSLNPQTGNWLANVGPHELVHALQFSNLGKYNIPRFVSIFSPDLARMFHSAIPSGMLEGIAVYHETKHVTNNGGRGHYPFFGNQFDATFSSEERWSMGQLMQTSSYTRPFGRHYIGGYEFTAWLHSNFGNDITRQALDFYMDFPFLGYGVALRHTTGLWPGQLYNRFEEHHENRIVHNNPNTRFLELEIPFKGQQIRQPKWLSDSKLIFYGSFYNARSGFYTYNLAEHKISRLITTNTVRDFQYDLSADRSQMVFSYYETDLIYDNTTKAELVQYNFDGHQKKQLTKNGRLYAPTFYGDELLALQSQPARSKLVALPNSDVSDKREVFSALNHEIISVAVHPDHNHLAIISNKNGQQALWITGREEVTEQLNKKPDIAFEQGSIFDPEWHPKDLKLLFSADFSGTMQLYEYDLTEKQILQITDSQFNALEGSYSPDGNRVAFIRQVKNEQRPEVLERTAFLNDPVEKTLWQKSLPGAAGYANVISDSVAQASTSWQTDSYSSGLGWLKPRTVLPFVNEVSNVDVYQAGLSLHSANTLSTQAYSADISYFKHRGWYDITYQNKTSWPGFKARVFSEPAYRSLSDIGLLGRQERSAAVSIPFRMNLNQNIYSTSLMIEPEVRQSQIRFFDGAFQNPVSQFADITIGNLFTQFNYQLQRNTRDVQPNTGIILFSELEHYLSGDELTFRFSGNDLSITSADVTALRAGIFGYVAPLKRWNQSLRIGVRGLTQSGILFDNQSLVSGGFSEPVMPESRNLLSFNSRYTIPITYVDDGGLLLPLYLSNIYLVTFTNTVTDPTFSDWYHESRTVFGIGIRANFRLSNLSFNVGVGFGYEPTRNQTQFFIGDF